MLTSYQWSFWALKSLRLALKKDQLSARHREGEPLQLNFCSSWGPLEVLELDVECDMAVYMDPVHNLKLLVAIALGSLTFHESPLELDRWTPRCQCSKLCGPSMTTLKRMYLRSGKTFSEAYLAAPEAPRACKQHAEMRFLDYVSKEQCGWKAQMPEGFYTGSLHECCCHACPECLARAGVPILCEQGWTGDGFDKYLRRNPSGMPRMLLT